MSRIAVLGAGAGGLSATIELSQAGHDVALWNRNPATLKPHTGGEIRFDGVLGAGAVRPALITTDLPTALRGAGIVVICLPSVAHRRLFEDLAALSVDLPIVLNPGHTGAALHARQVWCGARRRFPALAEFSTLTYVARVGDDGVVRTTGKAGAVRVAGLPGSDAAVGWAQRLFPSAQRVPDVLASSLSNVNLILHPPGAILGLAWVEATGGDFTFYVEGMTDAVAEVLAGFDAERLAVAQALGHRLPSLLDEMVAIGTVDAADAAAGDVGAAIRGGVANQAIKAPPSIKHRYYREDLPFGLQPFVALADVAGEAVPIAKSLLTLGTAVLGAQVMAAGLTAETLGLDGLSRDGLFDLVRA
jgi:opine dehydrogenase